MIGHNAFKKWLHIENKIKKKKKKLNTFKNKKKLQIKLRFFFKGWRKKLGIMTTLYS